MRFRGWQAYFYIGARKHLKEFAPADVRSFVSISNATAEKGFQSWSICLVPLCLTRTEMSWWAIIQMWVEGEFNWEALVQKGTKQPKKRGNVDLWWQNSDIKGKVRFLFIGSKFLLEYNYCKVSIGSFHRKVSKSKLLESLIMHMGRKTPCKFIQASMHSNHTQSTLESTLGGILGGTAEDPYSGEHFREHLIEHSRDHCREHSKKHYIEHSW